MTTRLELGPTFSSVSDLKVFHSLPRSRFLDVTQRSKKRLRGRLGVPQNNENKSYCVIFCTVKI